MNDEGLWPRDFEITHLDGSRRTYFRVGGSTFREAAERVGSATTWVDATALNSLRKHFIVLKDQPKN